jgi:fucose permease
MTGALLSGIGGAPLYPCAMHSVPAYFGEHRSQAVIGVLMAAAFVGCCIMPPVFGLIAQYIHVSLLPLFLALLTGAMVISYKKLNRMIKI